MTSLVLNLKDYKEGAITGEVRGMVLELETLKKLMKARGEEQEDGENQEDQEEEER